VSEFFKSIGHLTIYISVGIAILYYIGLIRNNKAYKIFTLYLVSIAVVQLGAYYVGFGGSGKNNLYFSHFYHISQFILLSLFYFELVKRKEIWVVMILVLLFLGYQFIDNSNIYFEYNPLGMSITQTILVIYSILYFYRCLKDKGDFLIVNIGIFFYLLSSTLIFASGNLVLNIDVSEEIRLVLVNVNRVLYLVFQILIIIEWYKIYRKNKAVET